MKDVGWLWLAISHARRPPWRAGIFASHRPLVRNVEPKFPDAGKVDDTNLDASSQHMSQHCDAIDASASRREAIESIRARDECEDRQAADVARSGAERGNAIAGVAAP